jgi:hypothetical protein
MLLGCMRNMVIFPSNAKQIIAIIARIIKLERWYNWGVLQFFDISNYIILCEILLAFFAYVSLLCIYYKRVWIFVRIFVDVCVYCVENALISFKKICQ